MAAVKRVGYGIPIELGQEHQATFTGAEMHMPSIQTEAAGNVPFEYQISQIERIIQIKAHNRDLIVKKNMSYSECGASRNNSNSSIQSSKLTNQNVANTYNTNANNTVLPNNMLYKNNNTNNSNGVAANNFINNNNNNNNKIRRQNQNYYPNSCLPLQPIISTNTTNSNSQAFTNNNQRKYNYFNTNYNNKKAEQMNSVSSVNMNVNGSMNLMQQLQKQQHQQNLEQQQLPQNQYNYGSNQNLLESFLLQQLNNQNQNQYQQQTPLFQNQFDNFSQAIPAQTYGAQSPLLFDYNLNTNKDINDLHNTNSLLSHNNNSTKSLPANKINNNFTNTNNVLFQHQQSQPNRKATLDALPQLNLQSIIDNQDITSNVTTPGSISRPNSSITSLGSSAPSSHVNSDHQENHSSASNTSSKSTLVDPLESIWRRGRESSGKNPHGIDFSLETSYFDDPDKLKESGLLGKYFS